MLHLKKVVAAKPAPHEEQIRARLMTIWGEELLGHEDATPLPEHPNPQFERVSWTSLNGWWDYAIVLGEQLPKREGVLVVPERFEGRIRVPFSPECELSGVSCTLQPGDFLWYRRTVRSEEVPHCTAGARTGERMLLHFEAVDFTCACFVNGTCVGVHEGGYLPFCFDVTSCFDLQTADENVIALCVVDPSDAGTQLRGKQSLKPGDIWYAAQSGIWQSVWLEAVPSAHIESASIAAVPNLEEGTGTVRVQAHVACLHDAGNDAVDTALPPVEACVFDDSGQLVASGKVEPHMWGDMPTAGEQKGGKEWLSDASCSIELLLGQAHLWGPEDPYLYHIELRFGDDVVHSYCAFRTCEVKRAEDGHVRFFLNGEPLLLRGVLDQGYWPDGLMTAPSDEALVYDIEAAREAGFNLMRKHIKVEARRWYCHCDRLGMLVWQDMVSGGDPLDTWVSSYRPTLLRASWTRYNDAAAKHIDKLSAGDDRYREEWLRTCRETISLLGNHPCIVTWVLFNEGWGQFASAEACALARSLDRTRPVNAVSGWYDQGAGDWHDVHNYFRDLAVWRDRVGDRAGEERAFAIGEFGGLTLAIAGHSLLEKAYGYAAYDDPDDWKRAWSELVAQADALWDDGLAAWVYTQLTDVEEETNGILTYDRKIKKL